MTISIRDATEDDIPAIFEVRTIVQENHLSVEELAEMGVTFETIGETLCEHPCIWVAEQDDQIVGFSIVDVEDAFDGRWGDEYVYAMLGAEWVERVSTA